MVENFDRINGSGGLWRDDNTSTKAFYQHNKITFDNRYFHPGSIETIRYGINSKDFFEVGPKLIGLSVGELVTTTQGIATALDLVHELIHAYYPASNRFSLATSHLEMDVAAESAVQKLGIKGVIPSADGSVKFFSATLVRACGHVKL